MSRHQSIICRRALELGANYPVVERGLVKDGARPLEVPPVTPEEIIEEAVRIVLTKRREKAILEIGAIAAEYPALAPRLWKAFRQLAEKAPAPKISKKSRRRLEYDGRVVVANTRG